MHPSVTDWIVALASALTMSAAFTALVVAWRAPKMAAQFAESLRSQNEAATERTRLRFNVFLALMRHRRQILHPDAIGALNLIEIAFFDCQTVRAARDSFFRATLERPSKFDKIVERYHSLIDKVGAEVGFGGHIGPSDIQSGYYPDALGMLDQAALADAEEKIARRAAAMPVDIDRGLPAD